jgi:hypothetical protein
MLQVPGFAGPVLAGGIVEDGERARKRVAAKMAAEFRNRMRAQAARRRSQY